MGRRIGQKSVGTNVVRLYKQEAFLHTLFNPIKHPNSYGAKKPFKDKNIYKHIKSYKMPDYKNGKCYAIVDENGREVYIGSTCQPLYRRFNEHKKDSRKHPTIAFYKYIHETGGWDNYRILLVEEWPCENKEQLNRREGEHIRRIQPVGNRQIPGRTRAEWEDVNKEKLKIYRKEYAIKNREKWRLKDKERREQKNDWYDNNKKEIQEWYEINKEKIQNWYEPYKKILKTPY